MRGSLGRKINASTVSTTTDAMGSQRFQPWRLAPRARAATTSREASEARKPIRDREGRIATNMIPATASKPQVFQAGGAGARGDRGRRRRATRHRTAKGRHISRNPAKWLWLTYVP